MLLSVELAIELVDGEQDASLPDVVYALVAQMIFFFVILDVSRSSSKARFRPANVADTELV